MTENKSNEIEQQLDPILDRIPKNTLGLALNQLPPAYGFVSSLLSNMANPIIDRLDECLRQYKKEIADPSFTQSRKDEAKFYYGKAIELRNYLVNFKATGNLPPLTNPHVAYNLFIIVINQYELFAIMLKETGDLSKPLCGDLLRAWLESLLVYSSHHLPEAKAKLEALRSSLNESNSVKEKTPDDLPSAP